MSRSTPIISGARRTARSNISRQRSRWPITDGGKQLVDLRDTGSDHLCTTPDCRQTFIDGLYELAGQHRCHYQHGQQKENRSQEPCDLGPLFIAAEGPVRHQRHSGKGDAVPRGSIQKLVPSQIGVLPIAVSGVVFSVADVQNAVGRQAGAVSGTQHGPGEKQAVAVYGGCQRQYIAEGAGDCIMGKTEIKIADLRTAKSPYGTAVIQNGYAQ